MDIKETNRRVIAQFRAGGDIDGMHRIGDERYEAQAVTAEGEERERLWRVITDAYPFFADHEAKAGRVIPVVVLERVRPVR
jgi:hypothetical protein